MEKAVSHVSAMLEFRYRRADGSIRDVKVDSLKSELPVKFPVKKLVVNIIPNLKKPDIFFCDEGLHFTLSGMIFASDVMTNGGYAVPKNRQGLTSLFSR